MSNPQQSQPSAVTQPLPSSPASDGNQAPSNKRIRLRRLVVMLAICAAIGVGVQFVSAINDNSVRNAISMIAAIAAIIGTAIWVYRTLSQFTSRIVAAMVTVALLVLPGVLFRIRGYSAEIIPQIEFRFAGKGKVRSETIAITDAQVDVADAGHVASTAFNQFLGPNRNAIVTRREFDVPSTAQPMKILWRQPIGEGWSGFSIIGGRCITLEQRGDQECVTCYRLADGELLWIHRETTRHENPLGGIGPRSMPTVVGDRVYVQGATGIVNCLDLASGKSIWRRDLLKIAGWNQAESEKAIAWGRSGSPLLIDDLCILPLGGPESLVGSQRTADDDAASDRDAAIVGRSLVALDAGDGTIRWTAGDDQISFASPIKMTFSGVEQVVTVNENSVQGHAIADGRALWSTRWKGQSNGAANCSSALPFGESSFWVGKAYGEGSSLFEVNRQPQTGGEENSTDKSSWVVTQRWRKPSILKTKFTHPAIVDRYAYAMSDGTLECVDLEEGTRKWAQTRGARYGHGHLVLVDDVMVVQTEAGDVAFVAMRNDQFEELYRTPALQSKTWNIPSVAGRYLAVRNDVEAIVYELPERRNEI